MGIIIILFCISHLYILSSLIFFIFSSKLAFNLWILSSAVSYYCHIYLLNSKLQLLYIFQFQNLHLFLIQCLVQLSDKLLYHENSPSCHSVLKHINHILKLCLWVISLICLYILFYCLGFQWSILVLLEWLVFFIECQTLCVKNCSEDLSLWMTLSSSREDYVCFLKAARIEQSTEVLSESKVIKSWSSDFFNNWSISSSLPPEYDPSGGSQRKLEVRIRAPLLWWALASKFCPSPLPQTSFRNIWKLC